ncbi:retrovirus-related pol polyprotein from transposon TNT 1-94 [Tanacetum coccineum]
MLDRTDFASWQQCIRLYCQGKENGVNILKLIDEGPFQMGTLRETLAKGNEGALHLGPERPRVYSDLSLDDKERYNADIWETNILLQGFPKDIYTLINHYTDAKDIWDNVKMLLEGSKLTKEDRESQLYDDFEHFRQNKGETIHDYYVRFVKLINDMRNIKMTMSRMQMNSKFVNNMLPEWGRFVTAESVETLREIVEEAKVERPSDRLLASACLYTKHSQELLEYVIGTCPKDFNQRDKQHAATPLLGTRKLLLRVNSCTDASGSQPRSNTKTIGSCRLRVVQIILWYLDSCCSKHITGDGSRLKNFVKKFIETIRFGNDHFGAIKGYGDYVIGDSVISRVYYVEGIGHNLFSVGQFCDSDLEVTFRKHSCYVRDTDGVELIKGSRGSNLCTISVEDMMKSSPIYLLSKASKNKSWLWHHRLNHLNLGTINDLARKDLVRGLPRLKFEKDHLCSACQLGKSKKHTHSPKIENTNLKVLNTLHMGLCGPIRVQNINGKKYILVIVDDYSRYIRIDNGTELVNQVLTQYYESVGIFHQKSVLRTPQQNGVVKRRNHTLVEAARTMLIFSMALMFLWAKAIATAFFGALCYPTNDSEDLGKLQPTADIGIFVGYAPSSKGYRIYNKRTRRIMETIHVQFNELSEPMDPVQLSTGPAPTFLTHGHISSGLVPNSVPAAPYVPPTNKELEILFQPMFDEYLEPPRVERSVSPDPAGPVPINSAGTPSSTTIDQDAPSPSHSPSSSALQSPSSQQGVAAGSTIIEDNPFAPVDNDPLENVFSSEPSSEASSSGEVSLA